MRACQHWGFAIAVDHRRQDLLGHRLDAFTTDKRTRLDLWGEEIMKFRTYVEPPKPMRGLEVPPEVVESLGQGKRPRVTITINGHSWKSRVNWTIPAGCVLRLVRRSSLTYSRKEDTQ
jgi:Domain of unknown function (DUF1905)